MLNSETFEKNLLTRSYTGFTSIRNVSVEYCDLAKTVP